MTIAQILLGQAEANKYAAKMTTETIERLTSFVGKKILKADGSASKALGEKYTREKDVVNGYHLNHSCSITGQSYSDKLVISLRTQISGGSHENRDSFVKYYENEIWIGTLDGGKIVSLREASEVIEFNHLLKPLPTVEEVNASIEALEEAKKEVYRSYAAIPRCVSDQKSIKC